MQRLVLAILSTRVLTVHAFREKPDKETAETYLESGRHLWNSGMFCFKASVLLEELKLHAPEIY